VAGEPWPRDLSLSPGELAQWVCEQLHLDRKVRVRPQNMAKNSKCARLLKARGLGPDAVLWAWIVNGRRPIYVGAFIRNNAGLEPADVFTGSFRCAARGRLYSFYAIGR